MPVRSRAAARRWPFVIRLVHGRPRLFLAAALMLVAAVLLPVPEWSTRLLLSWDLAVAAFLGMAMHLMRGATVSQIRARSEREDEGRFGVLILTVGAAVASLIAILAELAGSQSGDAAVHVWRLVLALVTILLSWAFIHVIFGLHYAHDFYADEGGPRGPALQFPGGEDPDYWDFAYFSFVIGMTSQVSDVEIASKSMRRTATAHSITSFLFNLALLSLMINVAASFISSN
jgi:uncharacterized membrane protein